jgi:hypothetical protein
VQREEASAALLNAKREYNIKLREERYQKKQALLRRQRKEQEKLKAKHKQESAVLQQQKVVDSGLSEKRSNLSGYRERNRYRVYTLENEYREWNREAAIVKREQRWQENTGAYIQNILEEAAETKQEEDRRKVDAKTRELLKLKAAAEASQRREEMTERRSESLSARCAVAVLDGACFNFN